MRILFCNYEYPPLGGGGGVINARLAEELARRHEVTVLTSRALGLPAVSEESGVRVIRASVAFRKQESAASMVSMATFLPSGARRGKRLLRGETFDVLNTHFVLPTGPLGHYLARRGRIPNVLSVHGGDLYDPSKKMSPHRHALLRSCVRWLLNRADAVVGQSKNTLANVRKYYVDRIEGHLIPLGIVRPADEGAASKTDLGARPGDLLLVTVGRLIARKGLEQLILLTERLKDLEIRLMVIGSGPEEERLRQLSHERNVADRVNFLGFVSEAEKFRILRACDFYVSTSQHEGFGLVFLEAMAAGLPVVCYDFGGQTDFLTDGETGHLVSLNDLSRFETACRNLLQDNTKRAKTGLRSAEIVEDFFIERCAEKYETLFEEVVERRKSAA